MFYLGLSRESQNLEWGGGTVPVAIDRYQLTEDITTGDGCLRTFTFSTSVFLLAQPPYKDAVAVCVPIYE